MTACVCMFSRSKISALLLVAIIPFLTTVTSSSQQATTSTVAFTTQRILFQVTVTVPQVPSSPRRECWTTGLFPTQQPLNFTAGHGDRIMGSFSSDYLVSFFVMSEVYAKAWNQSISGAGGAAERPGFCYAVGTQDQILVSANQVTSLAIDFTINNPGGYRFVFMNFDHTHAVHINFNVGIVS